MPYERKVPQAKVSFGIDVMQIHQQSMTANYLVDLLLHLPHTDSLGDHDHFALVIFPTKFTLVSPALKL